MSMPSPEEFNLMSWSMALPLGDDTWLGMQARNIALVDQIFLRPMELQALQAWAQEDRTPGEILYPLGALSQMWVFSLYEWLRTWRTRADHLLKLAAQHERTKPTKKAKLVKTSVDGAKSKERHTVGSISFLAEHVAKITNPDFISGIKGYRNKSDGLFSMVEALRVTLAKHEVPKSNKLVAQTPGYARMNQMTGSLYWHFVGEHGGLEKIDRRELANAFFDIDEDIEMSEDDPSVYNRG
jgi:hypothetical protein